MPGEGGYELHTAGSERGAVVLCVGEEHQTGIDTNQSTADRKDL